MFCRYLTAGQLFMDPVLMESKAEGRLTDPDARHLITLSSNCGQKVFHSYLWPRVVNLSTILPRYVTTISTVRPSQTPYCDTPGLGS